MQISGSSAVVFGGAGGLGEATVRRLHGAGVKVVIADLADDKGKELAAELGVPYVRTDVTDDDDVNARDRRGRSARTVPHLGGHPRWSGRRWPARG